MQGSHVSQRQKVRNRIAQLSSEQRKGLKPKTCFQQHCWMVAVQVVNVLSASTLGIQAKSACMSMETTTDFEGDRTDFSACPPQVYMVSCPFSGSRMNSALAK